MTAVGKPTFTLFLFGPLRLIRNDRIDVTPAATKARGMLALLGTSKGHRRSRAWLQDKLWSDRGPEQGAASLRQVLTSIRHSPGADRSCILTDQGWVALNPQLVSVALEPAADDWDFAGQPPEFCEGLDIADPEFEDWIRDQRAAWAERLPEREPPVPCPPYAVAASLRPTESSVLWLAPCQGNDDLSLAAADLLATNIAAQVARMGGIDVRLEAPGTAVAAVEDSLRLQLSACRFGEKSIFQARLTDPHGSTLLWTVSREMAVGASSKGIDPDVPAFVAEVAAASILELGRGGPGEAGSRIREYYRALRNVLSYDSATLSQCDRALAAAPEMPGAAARQAWRAHIRVISVIERIANDLEETRAEAVDLALRSLADDPINPIVNALASDVALHIEARPLKAYHLARTAVEQDRFSPFTHASLAQALACIGEVEQAHTEAQQALHLSAGQPNLSWWHMRCCITAIRCGRLEEATRYAQAAHELSPNFKPPLRCLAALRFRLGDERAAVQALQELKRLEPDFSLQLMASDAYPVASLREMSLLDVVKSGLV